MRFRKFRAKFSDKGAVGDSFSPRSDESLATSRRSFLSWVWLAMGGLAVAEVAWLALSFLRPRSQPGKNREEQILSAGPVERFQSGSVTAFPSGKFYLARMADGGFLALARECTHLGCTVTWSRDDNSFLCPCHGSAFNLQGDVLTPPAPRSLDLYAVFIENGEVKVDVSKRSRRNRFEPSQAVFS